MKKKCETCDFDEKTFEQFSKEFVKHKEDIFVLSTKVDTILVQMKPMFTVGNKITIISLLISYTISVAIFMISIDKKAEEALTKTMINAKAILEEKIRNTEIVQGQKDIIKIVTETQIDVAVLKSEIKKTQ
jgi:hypothetical protein